ncbi:MAG: PCRF domain-containing protein, partial [candidate division Zixibacteria bacterium]|nr:PCRF domain-containing protein [candidate division Zixibacteria bacterium]
MNSPDTMLNVLDGLAHRFEAVETQLSDPTVARNPDTMRTLGREHRRLAEIISVGEAYRKMETDIADNQRLIEA